MCKNENPKLLKSEHKSLVSSLFAKYANLRELLQFPREQFHESYSFLNLQQQKSCYHKSITNHSLYCNRQKAIFVRRLNPIS